MGSGPDSSADPFLVRLRRRQGMPPSNPNWVTIDIRKEGIEREELRCYITRKPKPPGNSAYARMRLHERLSIAPGSALQSQLHVVSIREPPVHSLSQYPPAEEYALLLKNVSATGRRSWKKTGTNREAVWSPDLETALLEGLKKYRSFTHKPVCDHRHAKRNGFIAKYIKDITGVERTRRQISSRIQQLKNTCQEDWILELILPSDDSPSLPSPLPHLKFSSNRPTNPYPVLRDRPEESSPPSTLAVDHPMLGYVNFTSAVYVEVGFDKTRSSTLMPVVSLLTNSKSLNIELPCADIPPTSTGAFPFHPHGYISSLNPMVQFDSPCPLLPRTHLSVFIRDCRTSIYTETTTLLCTSSPVGTAGRWMYTTSFVPGFWDILSNCADPTWYSIEQLIVPLLPFPSAVNPDTPTATDGPVAEVMVRYHFRGSRSSGVSSDPPEHNVFPTLPVPYRQLSHPTPELRRPPSHRNGLPFDFPGKEIPSDGPPAQPRHQLWTS